MTRPGNPDGGNDNRTGEGECYEIAYLVPSPDGYGQARRARVGPFSGRLRAERALEDALSAIIAAGGTEVRVRRTTFESLDGDGND